MKDCTWSTAKRVDHSSGKVNKVDVTEEAAPCEGVGNLPVQLISTSRFARVGKHVKADLDALGAHENEGDAVDGNAILLEVRFAIRNQHCYRAMLRHPSH